MSWSRYCYSFSSTDSGEAFWRFCVKREWGYQKVETKNKILVVDDKGINRYMLGNIFREEYEIVEASGGQMAIDIMEVDARNFAVVMLDIIMPVINGFGVLEYMKDKKLLDKLPVVIVTDDDSEETSDRAFEYKVADLVIKPFEPKIIKRRVQNIIELYAYREKYGNNT
ncbi:MAG: response regulator [Lachnospiraceae bacterium]|nr:response regulator [Lachnospiraceae bacterium]